MKFENLQEAKLECVRFLKRVEALEKVTSEAEVMRGWWVGPRPECAAVKRASLDLTKALAKMRKYE